MLPPLPVVGVTTSVWDRSMIPPKGSSELVVLPSPSSPLPLSPQIRMVSSASRATL